MNERFEYRRTWRLRSIVGDVCILRRRDLREDEHAIASFSGLSAQIDVWLADALARFVLLEIYQTLAGSFSGRQWNPADLRLRVKPRLEEAFRRGELVLVATVYHRLSGTDQTIPEGADSRPLLQPGSQKPETWIEIELVDEDGIPVEAERYQVELPDGRHVSGTLNAKGRARIEGIDPGTCEVWFPDRDASEWRRH